MIPLDDRGLLVGDGLFETLLAVDGRLQSGEAHLDRLTAGCATLGLPAPDRSSAMSCMQVALDEGGLSRGRAAVRLTLTAGSGGRGLDRPQLTSPRLFATAAPAPEAPGPVSLAVVETRRNETSLASRLKTLAYLDNILARREARAVGAEEALMLNTRGEIACAAAANIFWIVTGRLFTPALGCGVLAGIMRGRVVAAAEKLGVEVVEVRSGADALAVAEALFITNSLIGLRPVSQLGGATFAHSALMARLAAQIA